jgi:uncharacterized protein (DUF1810 family)
MGNASDTLRHAMEDPYDLQRFVDAQAPVYECVRDELRQGQKQSHWMWFVFPQIEGLGSSRMAREFAISSRAEAEAYLNHPILGPRLHECTQLVTNVQDRSIDEILGYPDDIKFRSSLTLFASVTADNQDFIDALNKFYGGDMDRATLDRL